MRQTINPYKIGQEYYSIPTKVEDLIEFLQKVVESVPEGLRSSIELEYDWEEDYGTTNVTSDLYYIRPPTAEELKAQEDRDSARKARTEAAELKQLAILQAKYKEDV
jgi:hypothetical protein